MNIAITFRSNAERIKGQQPPMTKFEITVIRCKILSPSIVFFGCFSYDYHRAEKQAQKNRHGMECTGNLLVVTQLQLSQT